MLLVFPLLLFNILPLSLIFASLILLCVLVRSCLGLFCLGLCASWTWLTIVKSFWPSRLDPQARIPDVGLETFMTVKELLWYYCSPVCG